ncbi:dermatan-sulfate epimerase-like protein [Acanthaster planci]|uniref:Dermatan-sulfate epimerase-like protein n=1 Tax=Acanthaster planci TaxID=133434 RepID=A0A8B7XQG9_ACAPL|nr:dermatan-sulfate epimerase-like protein [Acanthaster planci]
MCSMALDRIYSWRGAAYLATPMSWGGAFQLWFGLAVVSILRVTSCESQFTTHPMLFYSRDQIPSLRRQARTTHSNIAGVLEEAARTMLSNQRHYLPSSDYETFGGRWNEVYGNNLAALAMYCVVYPEDHDARDFAFKYMDIMASLPKWQVISAPKDEVPVAHSLTGFVTAFDFLYPVLGKERRALYLGRIIEVTEEMYKYSRTRNWGSQYIQNHVATNYLSLLHGSLVASIHQVPNADKWVQHVQENFGKTMRLLNHVIDGSLDEGVAYGSYTSRSVTQYAYLALRHLGVDYTQDLWMKEHFWFYYNTIMPNFERTVGIADSNSNWFYGPESQLVFLDTFVMRNGYGNWLAQEIRKHRVMERKSRLAPSESQRWCTLHTEFLWYDPTVSPVAPPRSGTHDLHMFSDWGVVTYSKVDPSLTDDTFLAFKSGKMHGRGIFDLVQKDMYASWVNKWKSFNPGHEHPDQNMFVFAPNGQPFITDGLYGPKYSFLNNVIMFSPSPTSGCFQPWEGQLGECKKWLDWRKEEAAEYGGELITASTSDGMVHLSGEAADGYNSKMRLKSVYRSLVLLTPGLLVVLDHIQTRSKSPLTHAAAFFNNVENTFEQERLGRLYGAKATIKGEDYKMFWVSPEGRSPKASFSKQSHPSEFRSRETNFVNITFKLRPRLTRMAFAFCGPSEKIVDMSFQDVKENGVSFEIQTEKMKYTINTVTRHSDPRTRQEFLGYPGYVSVQKGTHLIKFGVNSTLEGTRHKRHRNWDLFTMMSLSLGVVMLGLVVLYLINRRFRRIVPKNRNLFLGVVLLCCFTLVALLSTTCQSESCDPTPVAHETTVLTPSPKLPSVVVTSLPGSGSEILGWLFYRNPDFLHIKIPSDAVKLPETTRLKVSPFLDACVWTEKDVTRFPALTNRIKMLRWSRHRVFEGASWPIRSFEDLDLNKSGHQPMSNSKQNSVSEDAIRRKIHAKSADQSSENAGDIQYKVYQTADFLEHAVRYPNAQSVLHFESGSWGLKLQWLQGILGDTMRSVHVIRDPRGWVANYVRSNLKLYTFMDVARHIQVLAQQLQAPCQFEGLDSNRFYDLLGTPHKLLATLWAAYMDQLLDTVGSLRGQYRIVRYEDLVRSPRSMADNIYKFIGLPLPPAMQHQMVQAAHSGVYQSPHEGVVLPSALDNWETELTMRQIRDIEAICQKGMKRLGYSPMEVET